MPREFLLLQGRGCVHKACTYCDYYLDVADTAEERFSINKAALDQVTGVYGMLDIINSGSVHELDDETLQYIREIADTHAIHTIWFEVHWIFVNALEQIRDLFPNQIVRFRCGIESFDHESRLSMHKGMPDVSVEEISKYFDSICLLTGMEGQHLDVIRRDIELARDHFMHFSVNVFNDNSMPVHRDETLIKQFMDEIYPWASALENCEVQVEITDLGVG
ncbi:MAG: radical SAM protein [Clostridiales Family XIII bacterium]|jgi:hypothetical protein|nr:radical SAM protein [Clostridiales Family XIII bacterium]